MADPLRFVPGLLRPAAARLLRRDVAQTDRTRRDIERLPTDWPDELPAKITAWASGTQRASWTERAYDDAGARYDKPGGLSGSDTYAPAVPVGNGLMPPDAFPVDVWLRLRGFGKVGGVDIGPVYEFDWVCACAAAGSGTGSGGTSGVLVACCPGAVPATLTLTIASDCPALDGLAVTLTNGVVTPATWTGTFTAGGADWTADLNCNGGQWQMDLATVASGCNIGQQNATTVSCAPLHLTAAATLSGDLCGVCLGTTINLAFTVTE